VSPAVHTDDPSRVRSELIRGGVVLMPTDTLPGLHACIDQPEAIARITEIKGRNEQRPLLVLVASLEEALPFLELSEVMIKASKQLWPGPYTLVLPACSTVPVEVTAGTGTLAVRVPDDDRLRALLATIGRPLVSTSANKSGAPPAQSIEEAATMLGDDVDLVAELFLTGAGRPSTLLDLTQWPPVVIRAGAGIVPDHWNET
jgi:L-threonylcarbamoyladenylate synthase